MSNVVNPYIAGNPVSASQMFFGREDVFKFVRENLVGRHRDNVLVLYGQRRTGKTSVLYQMRYHLDARYLCVFLDLHAFALEGLEGFLWELANHIRRSLRRDYQIALPPPDRLTFMTNPRNSFEEEFLDQVWTTIKDQHILLMFDEVGRLQEQVQAGKLDPDIFVYLRHLMQHHERLNFLFSLGSSLEDMREDYAFLFSVGLYKKITFLDTTATRNLITQPIKDYYQVKPAAVERILQVTAGHPYYTQLLCHTLFNHWQQRRSQSINEDDVDKAFNEVMELGMAVLKHVWEESTPAEKAVMAGMACAIGEKHSPVRIEDMHSTWTSCEVVIPKEEITSALQKLSKRDIIVEEQSKNAYVFAVDLQRLWVQKYKRLEWVKDEIREDVQKWNKLPPHLVESGPSHISRRALLLGLVVVAGLTATGFALVENLLFKDRPTVVQAALIYTGHSRAVFTAGWSPNDLYIASGGSDNTVQVWSASKAGKPLLTYPKHIYSVNALAWMPEDGTRIASASADKTVQVWDSTTASMLVTYRGHSGNVRTLQWTSNGKRIASGGDDTKVKVWEASTAHTLITYSGHTERVWALSWSPDERFIASCSDDKTVQVWDASSGKQRCVYNEHNRNVKAVAWQPNGELIASGGDDGTVRVWHVDTRKTVAAYPDHSGAVLTIAWSPDGQHIASAGDDSEVQVWNVTNGKLQSIYNGHTHPVHVAVWSHDGKYIASASDDTTVRVWKPF